MANNIAVSITADVIDLQAKRAIMSAELKAATKDLNAFAKEAASTGATDQLRAGMLASAEAAEKARAKIALVTNEIKELSHVPEPQKHGFEGITASISETGVHLRETIGLVGEFRAAMMEIAEAALAAFAVERIMEWAEHMGEAAEQTKHMAEIFGMTVPEVQGLQAAAKETGMDVDALAKAMGILDKNAVTAAHGTGAVAQAFKAVGISANDGRTQMERLSIVADKFKDMDDGPKKVALAMELFGKSGKDMIPFLDRGSEGIAELDRRTQEYSAGVLVASAANKGLRDWLEQVNEKGVALAESTNESKVAWQGVSNVLTDAFAPVLKDVADGLNSMISSFIESYREGGTAKVLFDAFTGTLEALGTVVSAVAAILRPLGEVIKTVAENIQTLLPIVAGIAAMLAGPYVAAAIAATVNTISMSTAMTALGVAFIDKGVIGAATVAFEALSTGLVAATTAVWEFTAALLANPLTWVAVAAGVAVGGLVWLVEHVRSTTDAFDVMKDGVKIAMEGIKTEIQILGTVIVAVGKIVYDFFHLDWAGIRADWDAGFNAIEQRAKASAEKFRALRDDMKSHLSFGSGMDGLNYDPTGGKVGSLPEAKSKGGSFDPDLTAGGHKKKGPSIAQQLEEELELKKTNWALEQDAQGTYQQFSLQSEADFWQQALKRTDLSAKDRLEVEKKYLAARQALIKEKQAAEIENAKQSEALAMEAAKTEGEIAKIELQEKIAAIDESQRAGQITAKRALQEKAAVNQQLLDLDKDLADKEYQIKLKQLQDEHSVVGKEPQYYRNIEDQIALLTKQHADQEILLNRKKVQTELADNQKLADAQRHIWQQTFQGFSHNIGQMLSGQQTFVATVQNMWRSLQDVASRAIENMVQNWLVGLATKESASAAFHAKSVMHDAKQAAAGAWNAVVHIPIVGPILAPIAAAAAFAGVMAFSAEQGDWQVKEGLYHLHEKEMVLPAHLATPLRSMIQNGGANDNTSSSPIFGRGAGARGGDVHNHYHIRAADSHDVKRLFMNNLGHFATASKEARRQGHFAGMRRA